MKDLVEQLGINWKLLISQVVNFFVLLLVLRLFVYKPVLNMIKNRKEKIEEGLQKAEEAGTRLKEIDELSKNKIRQAEERSLGIIKETESKAKLLEQELVKKAEDYRKELVKKADQNFIKQKEEAEITVLKEAAGLVKRVIAKTVEMDPEKIDDLLIKRAVSEVERELEL
jgi:F-type H+-transporting ATPase subunit b